MRPVAAGSNVGQLTPGPRRQLAQRYDVRTTNDALAMVLTIADSALRHRRQLYELPTVRARRQCLIDHQD
jgi:hypothetical protein